MTDSSVVLKAARTERNRLYAEGDRLRFEADRLRFEADRLYAEGDKLWFEGTIPETGKIFGFD